MGPAPLNRPIEQKKTQIDSLINKQSPVQLIAQNIRRGIFYNQPKDCHQYPMSSVGLMEAYFKNGFKWGCASLISSNLALTVVTNTISLVSHQKAKQIFVTFGKDKPNEKKLKVKKIFCQRFMQTTNKQKYDNEWQHQFDYAILLLNTDQNLQLKFGSLGYNFEQLLKPQIYDSQFSIGSYLIEKNNSFKLINQSINCKVTSSIIAYELPHTVLNGSPIIRKIGKQFEIIGLHLSEIKKQYTFKAIKLTTSMFEQIKTWLTVEKSSLSMWIGSFGNNGIQYFASLDTHPYSLNIGRNQINDEPMNALCQRQWPELLHLDICINSIKNQTEHCLRQHIYPNLISLNLRANQIQDKGLQNLLTAKWFSLSNLNLSQNRFSGSIMLNAHKFDWPNLNIVDLSTNNIGSQGIIALVRSNLRHIIDINLNLTQMTSDSCKQLSQSEWTYLRKAQLSGNALADEGICQIVRANWPRLRQIDLNQCSFTDFGSFYLSLAKWQKLTTLSLANNTLGSKTCKFISRANWKNLTNLSLNNNAINSGGLSHLSKAEYPHLIDLNLNDNKITQQATHFIVKSDWRALSSFYMLRNSYGREGAIGVIKGEWRSIKTVKILNDQQALQLNRQIVNKFGLEEGSYV